MIMILIRNGVSPNSPIFVNPISYLKCGFTEGDPVQNTLLNIAVAHKDKRLIKLLLTNDVERADINGADPQHGFTPIMHAVKTNDMTIVKQLLNGGDIVEDSNVKKVNSIQFNFNANYY